MSKRKAFRCGLLLDDYHILFTKNASHNFIDISTKGCVKSNNNKPKSDANCEGRKHICAINRLLMCRYYIFSNYEKQTYEKQIMIINDNDY